MERASVLPHRVDSPIRRWTHPSVIRLLEVNRAQDPVGVITDKARQVVALALDAGWSGPPFDPLRLAELLHLETTPRDDVRDARMVSLSKLQGRIEYNPNRPRGRVRYSVAHEIAHTLFPDWSDTVRERVRHADVSGNDWQVEALCNIAAAEFLMPFGTLPDSAVGRPSMNELVSLQRKFDVSMEALAIRLAHLAHSSCAMFCASRIEVGVHSERYRLDYLIGSRGWQFPRLRGQLLPPNTCIAGCTAIGYTAANVEYWSTLLPKLRVEGVGIPPYPGSRFPRVVGLVQSTEGNDQAEPLPCVRVVRADGTVPGGIGRRFIVHLVNDKTSVWGGGGFAQALRSRWPKAQHDFKDWAARYPKRFRLGEARIVDLDDGISIASVVAQHGYGPSSRPRIRYSALREGLRIVTAAALAAGASLHMPRIGSGQAGGLWHIVEDIVRGIACDAGVEVVVYDLPGLVSPLEPAQGDLLVQA